MKDFEKIIQSINWQIEPVSLYEPIYYILQSGGKRLRPSLMQIACKMFGKDGKITKNAAIAIEIFHNFTLIHDDVMDNSPTRRNRDTVHKKWNVNTAILSGDAMMIKSYEFLAKVPKKYWQKVFSLFTKTALEVCEGQQYDMDFEERDIVTIEEYFKMIRLKTAVLLACSLNMGAILADAPVKDQNLIYKLGIALGIAFQLEDDYLDAYGDFETLGKQIGSDILCRKKTFLLLTAMQKIDEGKKKLMNVTLNSKIYSDEEKINVIIDIFNSLDMPKICEVEIEKYYEQASNFLNQISVEENQKNELKTLINNLKNRQK